MSNTIVKLKEFTLETHDSVTLSMLELSGKEVELTHSSYNRDGRYYNCKGWYLHSSLIEKIIK